jgi:hypothetical protein
MFASKYISMSSSRIESFSKLPEATHILQETHRRFTFHILQDNFSTCRRSQGMRMNRASPMLDTHQVDSSVLHSPSAWVSLMHNFSHAQLCDATGNPTSINWSSMLLRYTSSQFLNLIRPSWVTPDRLGLLWIGIQLMYAIQAHEKFRPIFLTIRLNSARILAQKAWFF